MLRYSVRVNYDGFESHFYDVKLRRDALDIVYANLNTPNVREVFLIHELWKYGFRTILNVKSFKPSNSHYVQLSLF